QGTLSYQENHNNSNNKKVISQIRYRVIGFSVLQLTATLFSASGDSSSSFDQSDKISRDPMTVFSSPQFPEVLPQEAARSVSFPS
ncbi:hypothetical protein PS056_24665, partial [Shigella sonnei]|nr:hypothetical protein [Shigella sonnei]